MVLPAAYGGDLPPTCKVEEAGSSGWGQAYNSALFLCSFLHITGKPALFTSQVKRSTPLQAAGKTIFSGKAYFS